MYGMTRYSQLIGGVLLVAGTTIGAAMLALPVSTGLLGFYPAVFLFVLFWAYMTYTAFLFLELNFLIEGDIDLVSMARITLGTAGQAVCWVVYLFLLYSLTTAYIAGSAPVFQHAIASATGYELPGWAGTLPLLLIFGAFVYKGVHSVDSINRVLMGGLVLCYLLLVFFLSSHVNPDQLTQVDWFQMNLAIPVIATSFGYHIIIPSLTQYLDHRLSVLKKVIWIGSLVPLFVYIIWEYLVVGIIPLGGESGLAVGYEKGLSGAELLARTLGSSWVGTVARFLSFFAIVTSFLGVSLSLRHFLADGFKIRRDDRKGKMLLVVLTFLPPYLITQIDPRAFLSALEYAGAYGVVVLLGLMPALMVWWARYRKKMQSTFRVPGGKPALLMAIVLSMAVMLIEFGNQIGLFE